MIPDTIMCLCRECGSQSYSKFDQNTNSCEAGHPQKTAFLKVGDETYIFGCKNCSCGQIFDDPYCNGCDSQFERFDAPDSKTGVMKPSNYQNLYTIEDIDRAQRELESIERPTYEEVVLSETVCPHCIDSEASPFKTEVEDLEMLGYFSNAPENGREYDELMYAPHGICQNPECIELEYPGNKYAMGVKLIPRTELKVDELHSSDYCEECEKDTESILNSLEMTYTCETCSFEKPNLSSIGALGTGVSDLDFEAKSAYSNALKGKSNWLTPPFVFSLAVNYHARSKSFDITDANKEARGTTTKSPNDWWNALGPHLRPQYQSKGTETYETHVLLTAYLVKSSMNHIEPLWLYSSKDRTGAGERKIRNAFEHYQTNQIVFSSIIPNVQWTSCNPERSGIESLVNVLEKNVNFWPIEPSQKQDVIQRANQWCLAFTQSDVYQQYRTTCLLNEPYTMKDQLINPIGMIESFSILAALKEMDPDGKEIVQRHLYPKQERADWATILNDKGKIFVRNLDRLLDEFSP
jgi:hypothetical protein